MSRRVTVVLSQGHRLGADRQHREDDLVARLLMSPQVEATMIGDLARIDRESTDQLCLESVAPTAVVLAWHNAEQAITELRRIGMEARLLNAPARESTTVPRHGQRHEFYYYDLNEAQPPEFYLDVVARVAEEADKSPVSLTNLATGSELPLAAASTTLNDRARTSASAPPANINTKPGDLDDHDELDDLMDALDRAEL